MLNCMKTMGRKELLDLLKEIDTRLDKPYTIIVCGGAAAILNYGLLRNTMDVDLLGTTPPSDKIREISKKVAEIKGLPPNWLNDGAKGFARYLPLGVNKRLLLIKGDFKKLRPYAISKVDLYVMKLAAFRPDDRDDLEKLSLTEGEKRIVLKAIGKIAKFDMKCGIRMDLYLREKGIIKDASRTMEKNRNSIRRNNRNQER